MADESAERIVSFTRDFGDRFVDVTVSRVPESQRYPDGIKYSMQYGNAAGETILRYDNFPDHPGAPPHHAHRPDGSVEGIEFEGVRPLLERFKNDVNEHGNDW